MATHIVLTQREFRALTHGKPTPLRKMKIGGGTRKAIEKKAKKRLGKDGPDPLFRRVVCKATRDGVICWVVGQEGGHSKRPHPRKKKPTRGAE